MLSSRSFGAMLLIHGAMADRTTNLYKLDVLRSAREETGQFETKNSRQLISRSLQEEFVTEPLMCGDTQIRDILKLEAMESSAFDMELVKNIRFDDAFAAAANYIDKQNEEQKRLATELKELQAKWYENSLELNAGKSEVPREKLKKVLDSSITKSFGDVHTAVSSDCSVLPTLPDQDDAYDAAKKVFATAVQEVLRPGKFNALTKSEVSLLCSSVLGLRPEQNDATCSSLCDALGARAASISEQLMVQAPSQGDLREQMQLKTAALDTVKAAIKDCESTRDGMTTWSKQIKQIASQHDSHGKSQRELTSRLNSVLKELEAFKESVSAETELLRSLDELIASTKEEELATKSNIKSNHDALLSIQQQTGETKSALEELKTELGQSQSAVKAMQSFKAGLVLSMQSFVQIYDDAIRKPLRDSGITKAIAGFSDDIFMDLSQGKIWAQPTSNVVALEKECGSVAQTSMAACELTPASYNNASLESTDQVNELCGAGRKLLATCQKEIPSDEYVNDVRSAIEAKQSEVKALIEGLRKELEDLSDPKNAASRGDEPEWLRRFAAILPSTRFYKDFVKKWTMPEEGHDDETDGTALLYNMVKVLKGIEEGLAEKRNHATDKLNRLNQDYVRTMKKDAELTAKLASIKSALNDEDSRKITLSTKLEEFEKGLEEKEKQRAALQKQLEELNAAFKKAESNMKNIFQDFQGNAERKFHNGASLLQMLRHTYLHSA